MLKNHLKVAWRNMSKYKGYTFINIAGLTLGLTICFLLFLWVKDEISYDRFHQNADHIYRSLWKAKYGEAEWETPLVNKSECAYVVFSNEGIAKCGLEEAYNDGATTWKKPISCHMYPVRTREYSEFTAVNYHQWEICDPACSLGNELKVPIYKFVKEALIRKFGETWYSELEEVAKENAK